MIQDIFPHSWDITYKNIKPGTNSMVLFFNAGRLLVCEDKESITFPGYDSIKGALAGQDMPRVVATPQALIDSTNVDKDAAEIIGWEDANYVAE